MSTPLANIRRGVAVLGVIAVVAVCGRHYRTDESWLASACFFVITVSSAGFSETSTALPAVQLFTIAVMLIPMGQQDGVNDFRKRFSP